MSGKLISDGPIGIFDSGVGGLSVFKAIIDLLPNENFLYFADQKNVPYGNRPLEEIQLFSEKITEYFISQGAKLVVVACNTASAVALYYLRDKFPDIPLVGMEPAVKPAAETTESGRVGVLATQATFQGDLYSSLVERFAQEVKLIQDPCIGLVGEIEKGNFSGNETRLILENALKPMMEFGIDTIVLGCTHYPFVFPMIKEIVGKDIRLIDPAPAIARQVQTVLVEKSIQNTSHLDGKSKFITTGDKQKFTDFLFKNGFNQEA